MTRGLARRAREGEPEKSHVTEETPTLPAKRSRRPRVIFSPPTQIRQRSKLRRSLKRFTKCGFEIRRESLTAEIRDMSSVFEISVQEYEMCDPSDGGPAFRVAATSEEIFGDPRLVFELPENDARVFSWGIENFCSEPLLEFPEWSTVFGPLPRMERTGERRIEMGNSRRQTLGVQRTSTPRARRSLSTTTPARASPSRARRGSPAYNTRRTRSSGMGPITRSFTRARLR